MKIQSYFLAGAALLAMAACDESFNEWTYQSENTQDDLITFAAGSVSSVGAINFKDLEESADSVQICSLTAPTTTMEGYETTYTITLNGEETLSMSSEGKVSYDELKEYVYATYGRRPTERTMTAVVRASISNGTDGTHFDSPEFNVTVTPEAPDIDTAYYYVGASNGWTCAADATYLLSNGGDDVYDNPVFTGTIPAPYNDDGTRADNWFKVIGLEGITSGETWNSQTAWVGCYTNGTEDLTGSIVTGPNGNDQEGSGANCWKMPASDGASYYRISLNMLDQTYEITPLSFGAYYYEIGGESGWSTSHALYGASYDGKYRGWYYLNGEFKFKPNADNWDGDLEYVSDGVLTPDGGPNVPDPGAGFYMIDLDAAALTYSLTPVTSIGIIGGFNSWGGDVEMSYNTEENCWEATTTFDSDTEYKFRMNNAWDVNWGGTEDNLVQDGANLSAAAGTYAFKLYLSYQGANTVSVTKE